MGRNVEGHSSQVDLFVTGNKSVSIKCGSGFQSGRRSALHLGIRESDVAARMEAFFVARMVAFFFLELLVAYL